jgi:hypothetical protein
MAWTPVVKPNASTKSTEALPNKTTLQAAMAGDPEFMGNDCLKWAYVTIGYTAGDAYTNGGVAADILGALHGWRVILGSIPVPFYNTTSTAAWEQAEVYDANNATAGSRKIVLRAQLTGSEIGSRVVAGADIPLIVFGY